MSPSSAYTIRTAASSDDATLRRLAALDSTGPIARPALIGEVAGEAVAALSLADGVVAADPFVPTAALVDLLRMRADALTATHAPRRRRLAAALWPASRPGTPAAT